MSPHSHPYQSSTATRHISNHGTSSAFSSSANPDEDWTKISDLAERRRIQNRIAQRNYRKKLKRRLEDLERRAGSSSTSPPQTHAELQPPTPQRVQQPRRTNNGKQLQQQQQQQQQQYNQSPEAVQRPSISPPPQQLSSQYTPPMEHEEHLMFAPSFQREISRSPPLFAYQSEYPAPDEIAYSAYPSLPYTTVERNEPYGYMAPVTLPSMMHFTDAIKREETMNPFQMSYTGIPAIDIQSNGYYNDPTTPPLSNSYEHSSCSDSGYHYPTTPLSMPASPPHIQQQQHHI